MGSAVNDGKLHRGVGCGSDEIGGVANEARKFILANEDERIGLNRRRDEIEKVFVGDAVGGLHRRWGEGDDARRAEFGGEAESDVSTHGVAQ